MDILKKTGDTIDPQALEKKMGVPVVCISAQTEENLDVLMDKVYNETLKSRQGQTVLAEGALAHLISDVKAAFTGLDELETAALPQLVHIVDEFKASFKDETFGSDLEAIVADSRYKYISKNYSNAKVHNKEKATLTKSDKADKVLTNKWASIPIFLVIIF